MDFLQLLSPELQATFFDSMSRGGGAAVVSLLQVAGRRVARRFRTPERQAALERALKNAFAAALSHWAISEQNEAHYVDIFQDWLLREEVLSEFSLLLTPNEEEELDIELLADEFEATGYSPEYLISVPFSELVLDMVGAFYMAAAQEEVLQEAIKIALLRQMVERMGALARIEVLAARQAEASEQAVDQLTLIERKSEALVSGQGLTNEWLQKIEGLLREACQDGMRQQLRIYRAVERLVARAYDVALEEGKRLDGMTDRQVAAQLAPVLGLLGEIRDQLSSEKAPDAAQLAEMEQTYRQTLIDLFETLTFKGISPSGRAIALPLADVYVELKAVADVPEAADTYSAEERRLLVEAEERGLDGDALGIQLDSLRYQRWKERARQPVKALPRRSIHEILIDPSQRGVVILGDPGSGKTTLLHYLALQSARFDLPLEIAGSERRQQLPIFVPLAAYDDYLTRSQSHLSLGDFLPIYYEKWHSLPALAPLFEQALAEGRAFLLLDGLDEVLERSTRQFVASQVEGLIQQWAAKGNRFALTSRVVGYREAPLAGNLPHVTVLDFGRNEIERFTEQWCYTYEKWIADGKETAVVKQRAESEKEALLSDVRSNASIERLAASPLLLTMLALLRRQVGKLPDRRIELYQRYVRTLIDNWQSARSQGARQQAPQRFDPHTAIAHLIELALWLQQHKPSGTASRHELDRILQKICLRFEGHDPASAAPKASVQAQQQAERFRKDMRHFAGLLVERGRDAFGFLHLTFQEYFVGRALARMKPQERRETILPHLHTQRWREPIMLCAGRLGILEQRRNEVDAYLASILNAKSQHEPILQRDLFLATAIATDDVGLSPTTLDQLAQGLLPLQESTIPTVRDTALAGLAQLARLSNEQAMTALLESLKHHQLLDHVIKVVKAVITAEACQPLRDALYDKLDDPQWNVRQAAVQGLSAVAASDEKVRDALYALLDDPHWNVRQAAVQGLSAVATSDEKVRDSLYSKLDDPHYKVRQMAVQGLSMVGASDEKVRDALYDKLDDPQWRVRQAAVQGLSAVAASDEKVRDALVGKLDDPDEWLRKAVVQKIKKLVAFHDSLRHTLVGKLDDLHWYVRQAAVQGLSAVVASDEKVRDALYGKLDDPSEEVREAAVQGISVLAASDETARHALVSKLDDPDPSVRQAAVEALRVLIGSNEAVQLVVTAKLDDTFTNVRQAVVGALISLLGIEPTVREIIISRLDNTRWYLRKSAAQALAELVESKALVRQAIIAKVDDTKWHIRVAVLQALAGLAETDSEVQEIMVTKLDDPQWLVRASAVQALAKLVEIEPTLQATIITKLNDPHWYVQQIAVQSLAVFVDTEPIVQKRIINNLNNSNKVIQIFTMQSLVGVVTTTNIVIQQILIEKLNDSDWSIRQAAVQALATFITSETIVQEAIISKLNDPSTEVRARVVQVLTENIEGNIILRQMIIGKVNDPDLYVQQTAIQTLSNLVKTDMVLRQTIVDKLAAQKAGVRKSAIQALTGLVGTDITLSQTLITKLDDSSGTVRAATIRALVGLIKSDVTVRQSIIHKLDDPQSQVSAAAAEVLATQAIVDEELRLRILAKLDDPDYRVRQRVVQALAGGIGQDNVIAQRLLSWLGFVIEDPSEEDTGQETRRLLANAYAPLLADDSALLAQVVEMLDSPAWPARQGAGWALIAMPGGPPEHLMAKLLNLINDTRGEESWPERLQVAELLINHRDRALSERAIAVTVEALDFATQPWYDMPFLGPQVRKQAAQILGQLDPMYRDEQIFERLARLLEEDEDEEVRDAAYGALLRLAAAPEGINN